MNERTHTENKPYPVNIVENLLTIFFFVYTHLRIFFCLDSESQRERQQYWCERKTSIGYLLHMPRHESAHSGKKAL